MNETALVRVEGVVTLVVVDAGSRSEHEAAVVRGADGATVRVHIVGDHPYEQPLLREHLGRRVRVEGTWRGATLRVDAAAVEVLAGEDGDERTDL
jgi:hypothetical protein